MHVSFQFTNSCIFAALTSIAERELDVLMLSNGVLFPTYQRSRAAPVATHVFHCTIFEWSFSKANTVETVRGVRSSRGHVHTCVNA